MRLNSLLTLLICCFLITLAGCGSEPAPSDPPVAEAEPASEPKAEPPAPAKSPLNLDDRGRALRGYDAVAYFSEGQAVEGKGEFRADVDGAEYYFANAENREVFLADPTRYQPANGGYCTYGVVLHKKFDGDPEVWSLHNDRLHVFLNEEVRDRFLSDAESNFEQVEANWPDIQGRSAAELEAMAEETAAEEASASS